jgi:hypothetical protein
MLPLPATESSGTRPTAQVRNVEQMQLFAINLNGEAYIDSEQQRLALLAVLQCCGSGICSETPHATVVIRCLFMLVTSSYS